MHSPDINIGSGPWPRNAVEAERERGGTIEIGPAAYMF